MNNTYEIDDFYVGPSLPNINFEKEDLRKFLNDWLSDEQKFMTIEIEEHV